MRIVHRSKQVIWTTVAALALTLPPILLAQQAWRWSDGSRIVVVPDVHGAYSELVGLLQATGVIDSSLAWSGGDTRLVSLGDLLDRGPESRNAMDLLMRLQQDAAGEGGAVHVILGNHELMNLIGDVRYVSAAEYAAFSEEEPEEARESAFAAFALEQPETLPETEVREAFEQRYPPGYFGHRLAFGADGRYGAWLLSLPSLIVIGHTAFAHAGLSEILASTPAAEINRKIGNELRRYLSLRDRLADAGVLPRADMRRDSELARAVLGAMAEDSATADRELSSLLEEFIALSEAPELGVDGPLWYRGSVYCSALIAQPELEAALERLDVERVVVGHTPTDDRRAHELYDGRLIMLDTGMLAAYYEGRPAALVIEGDRTFVQYAAPDERRPLEQGRLESGGLTESEILEALADGEITPAENEEARADLPLQLIVRHQGNLLRAIFYSGHAAELELAAHGLDRLLGFELVPPTVAREVDGQVGALQLEYADAITESERLERNVPLEGWCPIGPQLQLMYAFDALTYNTGRSADTIVYRQERSVVKLVDHGRAFGTARQVRLAEGTFELSPALRDALASLDQQSVQAAIGAWISARQIRALLARRDAILEQAATD